MLFRSITILRRVWSRQRNREEARKVLPLLASALSEQGELEQALAALVEGKIEKFYSESVLLEQPFVMDSDTTVGDMIAEVVGRIRENIQVRRFARYKLGAD